MKYPEHRMSLEAAMPLSDSVLTWLGHQLELRKIDSVIYTRYVISLLQQDMADIDSTDRDEFWDIKKDSKKAKERRDVKKKPVSEEERRKNAAVECLLSVSDEDNDIESLVEELFIRLKETKSSQGYFTPLAINTKDESKFQVKEFQDPAERYYAAFPALPGDGTPPQLSPSSDDNIWRKNRKSGSLAGETSESKEGSPLNVSPEHAVDKTFIQEVKTVEKSPVDSKSYSNSPAAPEKRKRSGRGDSNPKISPSAGGRKKNMKGKREIEAQSKAVRFLSWPPPGHVKKEHGKADTDKQANPEETEEEKYCSIVEQMLKEMLLSGKKHVQTSTDLPMWAYFPAQGFTEGCFTEWFREDSQSPEFTENDDWYTQPLEHIFYTPVSQTKRLYKRHSYPPMLNFGDQLEWSSIVTEQFLSLKKTATDYILLEDVFDPNKASQEVLNEEGLEILLNHPQEALPVAAEQQYEDLELNEEKDKAVNSDEVEDMSEEKSEVGKEACKDQEEETVEESDEIVKEADETPAWYNDDPSLTSPNVLFPFDQPEFADLSSNVDGKSKVDFNTSALPLTLPCLFPGSDPDCLVPASDTSSTVSSVEKGYFSDVTETSFVFDMSRHSSPFPDMLLLMNYGEDDDTGQMTTSTASSLKGSRLESLFESSRQDLQENMGKSEVQQLDYSEAKPEFDFCADDLFLYGAEEEDCILYGTRNMFPNGATSNGNPQGSPSNTEEKQDSETETEEKSTSVSSSQLEPQSKFTDSTSEDERDESACFPSDLFNSFSSVGESSGGSVLLAEPGLVEHNYVLDLLDSGEVSLQNECSSSYLVHLSPLSGSGGSCWQSKILLHDYGDPFTFGSLEQSSELAWDSVLSQKKHIWSSAMSRSPVNLSVTSPTLKGELWQLWDVNSQRKMPDMCPRNTDTSTCIWNSILSLSVYAPDKIEEEEEWNNDDEVFLSEIINEEDAVLGLQFLEEINGIGKGPRYERSVSESDLRSMADASFLDLTKPNLDISYELIPSENSAFQGVVPKQLHHVRSAPNLRYKSLVSMVREDDLHPPGLASIESPVEHLYFSAKTHFRPIQTPVATPDEDVEFQPKDLFGGMSDNSGTPYQQFLSPGEEEESKFRPKFKIQKDLDKYIQTGGSLDESDIDYERFRQQQLEQAKDSQTEFIEEIVVGSILEEEKVEPDIPDQSSLVVAEPEIAETDNVKNTSLSKSEGPAVEDESVLQLCTSLRDMCSEKKADNSRKITEQSQGVDSKGSDDSKWDGQKIKEMHLSDVQHYHDIWSAGYEMDLHPFSVDNETLYLPCAVDETLCSSEVTTNEENKSKEESDKTDELYLYYLDNYPEYDSYILSTSEDCSGGQNYEVSGLMPIPHQAVYSSDLEKQWLEKKALSGRNAKRKSQKLKLRRDSIKRKPCSFFLEGNCRRSDCRFSHDLSSITCRFWEEGLCFKGSLCPFYHGYPSDTEMGMTHDGKSGDRYEFKKDEFPELDNFGRSVHKELHSQKINRKRQAHKEFLKKTLSSRKKNRPSRKLQTRTVQASSC
ncbi:uncharacterized protein [Haliotis cracherodii]|uniref:uncharacterized protein n=1 Tax=Haliotis cracherodii TaxID=6455 RepID=UPI0039EA4018